MTCLYIADISTLPDPKVRPKIMDTLSPERKQRIARCTQEQARRQRLGAGLLLQQVFHNHEVKSGALRLGKYGKPEIEGLNFNLSHSGNIVACAVSKETVGCDVEKLREAPPKIGDRFFCEREKQYLRMLAGQQYDREFFRLWTIKESYLKMTGEGLSFPMRRLEIDLKDSVKIIRDGILQPCFVREYIVSGYQVSVCSKEDEFAEMIQVNI